MRYLIESKKERKYVKDYGFLYFAKNIVKSLNSKSGQIFLDCTKRYVRKTFKAASKRTIQKTANAYLTGDLIGKSYK